MMPKQEERALVIECCKAFVARRASRGHWDGDKVPACIKKFRSLFHPYLDTKDEVVWVGVVEAEVQDRAVKIVATLWAS